MAPQLQQGLKARNTWWFPVSRKLCRPCSRLILNSRVPTCHAHASRNLRNGNGVDKEEVDALERLETIHEKRSFALKSAIHHWLGSFGGVSRIMLSLDNRKAGFLFKRRAVLVQSPCGELRRSCSTAVSGALSKKNPRDLQLCCLKKMKHEHSCWSLKFEKNPPELFRERIVCLSNLRQQAAGLCVPSSVMTPSAEESFSLGSRSRSGRSLGTSSATTIVACFCLVLVVGVVAAKFARQRHAKRDHSQQFVARCANPRHGVWKSRESSNLKRVRKNVLRALMAGVVPNKRTRVFEDCIGKNVEQARVQTFIQGTSASHLTNSKISENHSLVTDSVLNELYDRIITTIHMMALSQRNNNLLQTNQIQPECNKAGWSHGAESLPPSTGSSSSHSRKLLS